MYINYKNAYGVYMTFSGKSQIRLPHTVYPGFHIYCISLYFQYNFAVFTDLFI